MATKQQYQLGTAKRKRNKGLIMSEVYRKWALEEF